ncbi:MAG: hypothetical protein AAF215_31905 [Cyanobacteria bacterium P01_A01_bin.123]
MFIILAGGLPNAILTPEEVRAVIQQMSGVHQLIVQLLYGSGLRLREAMQLRWISQKHSNEHHNDLSFIQIFI